MPSESQSYATGYATARTCLATLARISPECTAITFRELLLTLDDLHDGATPATYPLIAGRADLLLWLESAVRRMIAAGGDADALELILRISRAV
ncbi:hypothetical protein [Nocardioides psychrotolerans]|nr:hypothetical protein [Nocardioides psychrotolerans]